MIYRVSQKNTYLFCFIIGLQILIFQHGWIANPAELEHADMMDATNDPSFSDIEDAFQYHCALRNQCSFLITINTKDFSQANHNLMKVITPNEFANNYLV